MKFFRSASHLIVLPLLASLVACAPAALHQLDGDAAKEAQQLWDRYVESGGDIAAATTWERKVDPGVGISEIEEAFVSVAAEDNIKAAGEFSPVTGLEQATGEKPKFLKIYSYCNPSMARAIVDFSPPMAAFLPCRIAVVERDDGLWIYAMNMDILLKLGRKLPPDLQRAALQMRQSMLKMLDRGAHGDF